MEGGSFAKVPESGSQGGQPRAGSFDGSIPVTSRRELNYVMTYFKNMNDVEEGEKGKFGFSGFEVSGGWKFRTVKQYVPGWVSFLLLKEIRRESGETCATTLQSLEEAQKDLLDHLDQNLRYLIDQPQSPESDATISAVKEAILLLKTEGLESARNGLKTLAKSYTRGDLRELQTKSDTFLKEIGSKLDVLERTICSLEETKSFFTQEVPPSGIFLVEGSPRCLVSFDPEKPDVLSLCSQKETARFFKLMKIPISRSEDLVDTLIDGAIEVLMSEKKGLQYGLVDPRVLFNPSYDTGFLLVVNGRRFNLHAPIVSSASIHSHNLTVTIPTLKDSELLEHILLSLYTKEPLKLTQNNIHEAAKIGFYLGLPHVLDECESVLQDHPEWADERGMRLWLDQTLRDSGLFTISGAQHCLLWVGDAPIVAKSAAIRFPKDHKACAKRLFETAKGLSLSPVGRDPFLLLQKSLKTFNTEAKGGHYVLRRVETLSFDVEEVGLKAAGFGDKESADSIITINGLSFYVHEALLRAESDTFDREYATNEKELPEEILRSRPEFRSRYKTLIFNIPNISDPKWVAFAILFLYDKAQNITEENIQDMVRIGQYLHSDEILDACERAFLKNPSWGKLIGKERQAFLNQEISPSGIFKINGERQCLFLIDPETQELNFPKNPQVEARRFFALMKGSVLSFGDDLSPLVENTVNLESYSLIDVAELYYKEKTADLHVSVNGKKFHLHRAIVGEFCDTSQLSKDLDQIPGVVGTTEIEEIFQSFYTLEPLPISKNNLEEIVRIGIFLKSSCVLSQCRVFHERNKHLCGPLYIPELSELSQHKDS